MTCQLLSCLRAIFFGRGFDDRDVNFLKVALLAALAVLLCVLLFTPWGILPHLMDTLLSTGLINPDGTLN